MRSLAQAQRLAHLALNWLVFSACYPLANLVAERAAARRSLALAVDGAIPFVPWTIIPYASSGLLFTLAFFAVRTPEQLRVASRRLLAATVAGTLACALFPARFPVPRPVPAEPLLAVAFRWLDVVDRPFNQCPSLHVAYCVVLWTALAPLCRSALVRGALASWLVLVAASTLFTWQHQALDVAGGLVLGCGVAAAIRPGRTCRQSVSFYYVLAAGLLLLVGACVLHSWIAAWAAASLALVAWDYGRRRADFLGKRAGRHPVLTWMLFWPYLAGYRITWLLVLLRERGRPACTQAAPGLWVGRRLTRAESRMLPQDCWVVDLGAELPETGPLRGPRYLHYPLLDLQAPRPGQLRTIVRAIALRHRAGEPVYVHCAMGYSRSRLVARLYLRSRPRNPCPAPSTS